MLPSEVFKMVDPGQKRVLLNRTLDKLQLSELELFRLRRVGLVHAGFDFVQSLSSLNY